MNSIAKIDIRRISLFDLEEWFVKRQEQKFRGRQVYEWLWAKNTLSFAEMTNLSLSLRDLLSEHFVIPTIELNEVQYSLDGTIKSSLKLSDGEIIESVLIPVPSEQRFTACLSSQVGCSLSCSFCATGQMKRKRNLFAHEIIDQFHLVNQQSIRHFRRPLTNIVYMGMGEPLLNYAEVMRSTKILNEDIGLASRRLTISTAGIAKMIRKLAQDQVKFNLALSLHAADDTKRNEIMPINETNKLEAVMEAIKEFYQKTKNQITFEYIALDRFNDTPQDAHKLARLCRIFPVKVNIIEYNPIEGYEGKKSPKDRLHHFARILQNENIRVTIRRSRGKDIDAACGQLANK